MLCERQCRGKERTNHRLGENICKGYTYLTKDCYPTYTKNIFKTQQQENGQPVKTWAKDLNRYLMEEDIQMAKKHIKIHFTSQVFREMQIKTTIYYNTPIGMAKSKTLTTNAGEDVEQQKLSCIAGGNAKWYSHVGRQFGNFLQN